MNTVINLENNNHRKIKSEPLFLGNSLGLQRYDIIKYPVFRELTRKQKEFIWSPEEISLQSDRNDYESLTGEERFIFEKNLSFQTVGDSLFSRSIDQIKKHVTNNELENAMSWWGTMETVHSESYSYVLDAISRDPNGFFDKITQDKEIIHRASEIRRDFDKLLNNNSKTDSLKQDLFKSVLNFQIAEGLTFYVSFACSFWFGSQGRMTGNADIINMIKRDENCHRAITQNILKIWADNKSEGFQDVTKENKQLVYDTFGTAVENEKRWADYLFSGGSLVGLNANILKAYSEWLGNTRLRSLGYDQIFDQKTNPIGGWLDEYNDSSKVQVAPQEREITTYKKGALKGGLKDAEFSF